MGCPSKEEKSPVVTRSEDTMTVEFTEVDPSSVEKTPLFRRSDDT